VIVSISVCVELVCFALHERDGNWHGKGMEPDLLTCTMVKENWHGKGVEPDLLTCTMVKRRLAW
jgi:hypothetical protein